MSMKASYTFNVNHLSHHIEAPLKPPLAAKHRPAELRTTPDLNISMSKARSLPGLTIAYAETISHPKRKPVPQPEDVDALKAKPGQVAVPQWILDTEIGLWCPLAPFGDRSYMYYGFLTDLGHRKCVSSLSFLYNVTVLYKHTDPDQFNAHERASEELRTEYVKQCKKHRYRAWRDKVDEYNEGVVCAVRKYVRKRLGSRNFGLEFVSNSTQERTELMLTIDDSEGDEYISEKAEEYLAEAFGFEGQKAVWRFSTVPDTCRR